MRKHRCRNGCALNDNQIRSALKRKLITRYQRDAQTLILDELGLRHGAARVDVAVVNGSIHGYEIKSDRDTLRRLPKQAKIYNSVLDRVTLVVGHRHAAEAKRIVPDWWGIQVVKMGPRGGIQFSNARNSQSNPSPDALAIAKLLWRDEALNFLDELGLADGLRSKPRAVVYARLAGVTGLDTLRRRVRQQLRSRTGWRSDERRMSSGG